MTLPMATSPCFEMVRPQLQSWYSHPGTVSEPNCGVGIPGKHCSKRPPQAPGLPATPTQTSPAPAHRKPGSMLPDLGLQNLLPWV